MTPLPAALLERLTATYEANADATRAVAMCAYMRGQFEFLGIATPARRALDREVVAGLAPPSEPELRTVALACFALEPREYQYFACDYYLPALGAARERTERRASRRAAPGIPAPSECDQGVGAVEAGGAQVAGAVCTNCGSMTISDDTLLAM